MAIRFALASGLKGIENELQADFQSEYVPFFNAYPGGKWPVVLSEASTFISYVKWGLIPYWSRWNSGCYNCNVFFTDLVKHPVYRVPIRQKRCLVPVNCFYLWSGTGHTKQPFAVYIKDQKVFTLAGIYDVWKERETNVVHYSFSLISTYSCKRLKKHVQAMPVIIPPSRRTRYLKKDTHLQEVMRMLQPFESDLLNLYPVSTKINNPLNNDKSVLQPVGERIFKEFAYQERTAHYFDR